MERRNRSLEAYNKLVYVDSLEGDEKAQALLRWHEVYMKKDENFELTLHELKNLSELFYKNINFLKQHKDFLQKELNTHHNIKKFFTV